MSEMKVPIRPAPPPPANPNASQKPSKALVSRSGSEKVNHGKVSALVQKKKPPPRPPPPKIYNLKQDKRHIPARPSQLITSLFHKKNSTAKVGEPVTKSTSSEVFEGKGNNMLSLIDFSSPPSSPTFTTRSSSDALSVNSFGSDGITPCSTSSGNTSNVESGFEDDFDSFLGSTKRQDNQVRDPWSLASQDQMQRAKNPSPSSFLSQNHKSSIKNSSWVTFPISNTCKKNTNDISTMPTIIRVKPERPKPPAKEKVTDCVSASNINVLAEIFENCQQTVVNTGFSLFQQHHDNHNNGDEGDEDEDEDEDDDGDDDDGWSSESPPMPTCPPPAPPFEVLQSLLDNGPGVTGSRSERPHGVALYDFEGEDPNDLSFKENDVVNLVRKIDDNWLVGEVNGREGTVPANFIGVRVPLPDERNSFAGRHVTALYAFHPETCEDLEFQHGSVIKVLGRINEDWLYGEFNGRTGQFPANFVDRVPPDLPLQKN